MQDTSPVTVEQLRAKAQKPAFKFEIYVDAAWVDLCDLGGENYLKPGLAVNPSGAGPTPAVIAGTWSAEIKNPNGIFHPFHPTSDYADYFRIGRQVRISIGGVFGGTAYYFQRIIGYMNAPQFDTGRRTVSLSGNDYSKQLCDYKLSEADRFWGDSATFSTVATSSSLGSEIYAEGDALEIGAGEANNVTNWTDDAACNISSTADAGGGSTYVALIEKVTNVPAYAQNVNVGAVVAGTEYEISFDAVRSAGESGSIMALAWLGAVLNGYSEEYESESWGTVSFRFTATASTDVKLQWKILGDAGTAFKVDNVTIKEVTTPGINATYVLPDESEGAYAATLNGVPIYAGDPAEKFGWQESGNVFSFVEGALVTAGTDNLIVYYYTAQVPEEVVADILADAGRYADKSTALAAMSYTATGITIPKVWVNTGTSAQAAIEKVCERVNYRFWFDYAGVPQFKTAPAAGAVDFAFESFGDLAGLNEHQDLEQIRNRIDIEGVEQATLETTGAIKKSRLKGTASDDTSIAAYLEHAEKITNDLFQDQPSLDAMCAAVLAERKDPKWYVTLNVGTCVAPLEVGDTVTWAVDLTTVVIIEGGEFGTTPSPDLDGGTFLVPGTTDLDGGTFAGEVAVLFTGIIRSISLNNGRASYVCEITGSA